MYQEKSAQDLMEYLRRAGSTLSTGAGQTGDRVKEWYAGLNPEVKKSIMSGLLGAGTGGLLTGTMAALTPRDEEEGRVKSVLGPALLGALMGGTAGAAIPYGLGVLKGTIKAPGGVAEQPKPVVTRGLDNLLNATVLQHPAMTAGTALGLGGLTAGLRARTPVESVSIDPVTGQKRYNRVRNQYENVISQSKPGTIRGDITKNIEGFGRMVSGNENFRIPGMKLDKSTGTAKFDINELLNNLKRMAGTDPKRQAAIAKIEDYFRTTLPRQYGKVPGIIRQPLNLAGRATKAVVGTAAKAPAWYLRSLRGSKLPGRLALLAPLAGLGGGALVEKYLEGKY